MSYFPLRDRYRFDEVTNAKLLALAEAARADAERALHEDQCHCLDPQCAALTNSTPEPEEVLAYVLERGLLTLPASPSSHDED